jgi:hypothetical protein
LWGGKIIIKNFIAHNGTAMMRCTSDTSTKHDKSFYFLGRKFKMRNMYYCKPNNAKDWKKIRHFFDVRNMVSLRNRRPLCVFSETPFPHIIDFNEEDVCIENLKLMTVDDFISAVGKNKNGQ